MNFLFTDEINKWWVPCPKSDPNDFSERDYNQDATAYLAREKTNSFLNGSKLHDFENSPLSLLFFFYLTLLLLSDVSSNILVLLMDGFLFLSRILWLLEAQKFVRQVRPDCVWTPSQYHECQQGQLYLIWGAKFYNKALWTLSCYWTFFVYACVGSGEICLVGKVPGKLNFLVAELWPFYPFPFLYHLCLNAVFFFFFNAVL